MHEVSGTKEEDAPQASNLPPVPQEVKKGAVVVAPIIKVGENVPAVTFRCRIRDSSIQGDNPFAWKDVTTDDLFKGRRAVIFALPGAFTPTCSSTHLPGYEAKYEEIKACGVHEVYCLSVNDAFVMRQWGLHQKLEEEKEDSECALNPGNFTKVKLLPDGACHFTRGMGMSCTWEAERGFGESVRPHTLVALRPHTPSS